MSTDIDIVKAVLGSACFQPEWTVQNTLASFDPICISQGEQTLVHSAQGLETCSGYSMASAGWGLVCGDWPTSIGKFIGLICLGKLVMGGQYEWRQSFAQDFSHILHHIVIEKPLVSTNHTPSCLLHTWWNQYLSSWQHLVARAMRPSTQNVAAHPFLFLT